MSGLNRARFATRLAFGVSAFALAVPALAQDAAEEDQGAVGDIVVTAQKREQNLQDVPIAISAIGAERIEQLDIRETKDLSGLAPNVTIVPATTNNTAAVISIRGIPTPADENFGLDTANALYVDGVYMARSAATSFDVADIERIEVLRGPQGTLFGRNTTGGAIAFITRDPSDTMRFNASAGYGNFEAWNAKVIFDPGEIMGIRTSFAYAHSQRNGTFDNILAPNDRDDPGARESDSARFAMMADLGGTGSIRYAFDWTKITGRPSPFQLTNVADGTFRGPILGVSATQQAPVQQYLAGATFFEPGCAALAAPQRAYREQLCLNTDRGATDELWGHNFRIENDFGGFSVKLTAGYRSWRNRINGTDLDGLGTFRGPAFTSATLFNGMPVGLLAFIPSIPAAARPFIAASPVPTTTQGLFDSSNFRKQDQFSQELEVSGRSDMIDWVVGAFYFWEKGSEDNAQNSGFILDTNTIFNGQFGAFLGPLFAAANPARYRMVVTNSILRYSATSESTALYGQATFYPGGREGPLDVTAGLRYTWDIKQMMRTQNGTAALAVPEIGKNSFSKLTWNIMLGYRLSDDIKAYARVATGYRSGGFNARDDSFVGTTTLPSFLPESVTSYEVGLKTELLDRRIRLNIAGYYNRYKDLAITTPVARATPGTFGTRVVNAGLVDYAGIEIEGMFVLSENFTLDGSFGYVDINTKEFLVPASGAVGAPIINIASIVTPGYTSPYTANVGATVQFPLGAGETRFRARVGYTYESTKYSFGQNITVPFNEQIKSDPRNLLDAQIGIENIPLGGGTADIRVWGRNLTDTHDVLRGIDFGALGYAGVLYGDPATYGVTVGIKF